MPKPWWSDSAIFAQLNSKKSWSGLSISYAFPTSSIGLSGSEKNGFSSFSAPQKNIATEVIQLWDDLINPRLVSVGADPRAQIKFANSSAIDFAQTYLPSAKSQPGSVWLNPFKNNGNAWTNNLANPTYGEWGYYIYIHEFGHALGLNHAGAYDRGSPTYENTAKFFQDTQQYTVMSYFSAENSDGSWLASDGLVYSPQTPMLYDIMSIQRMYGADLKTRAGDTIYGYNANAGQNVYNFEINQHPVLCIYDAGGKDTLDNSNSPHACSLNLNPGSFSNTDMMTFNISIAANTWIENAVGGLGDDFIFGNALSNQLDGSAGDDTLFGGEGNDTLIGGQGYDQMMGDRGSDTFRFKNVTLSPVGNGDLVLDFSTLQRDKIDISAIDANILQSGKQSFTFIGSQSFSGAAGELRFANGKVEADVNGDRLADLEIILQNVQTLKQTDFIL